MRSSDTIFLLATLLLSSSWPHSCLALSTSDLSRMRSSSSASSLSSASSRRDFFQSSAAAAATSFAFVGGVLQAPLPARAADSGKLDLTDEQLKEIVKSDLLEKQFLVTGKLTPSIYSPGATFTDEIDTYQMDQWMKGTQKLFVGEKSEVRLVGDVDVSPSKVEFRFDEDLMFRVPFRPTVHLTGRVELARDADTGYISSYREFWDQDVATVLKSAKF